MRIGGGESETQARDAHARRTPPSKHIGATRQTTRRATRTAGPTDNLTRRGKPHEPRGTEEKQPRQASPPHDKQDRARGRTTARATRRATGRTRPTTTPEGKQDGTTTGNSDRRRAGTTTAPDDDQPTHDDARRQGQANNRDDARQGRRR